MHPRLSLAAVFLALAAALAAGASGGDPDDLRRADEQILEKAGHKTDPASLVALVQDRTLSAAEEAELEQLIRQLGDPVYAIRVKASARLVEIGARARGLLRRALRDNDLETVRRVELCLSKIPPGNDGVTVPAATRLLAHHKPPDAAAALLSYLPFADEEMIVEAVQDTLAALAVRDGKADETLLQALEHRRPFVRAAAAEALGRGGAKEATPAILKVAEHPDPHCRLQAATGLLHLRQRDAVPVLIALLAQLPRQDTWRAEELLLTIAGDTPPKTLNPAADPVQARDAWLAWWKTQGAQIDLAKVQLDQGASGLILIGLTATAANAKGSIIALGPDKKQRWEIAGNLQAPVDVQPVGKNRLLICDYRMGLVTERDFRGNILWEKKITQPLGAQRLPNGHTLIMTRLRIFDVDRTGNETVVLQKPTAKQIVGAAKLRDGSLVVRTKTEIEWYDAAGKLTKAFAAGKTPTTGSVPCVLPNRNVLVAEATKRIAEYDGNGNVVWQVAVKNPTAALRLPNGNTLANDLQQKRIVEFNRAGQEVWQLKTPGIPYCLTRL